MVKRYNDAQWDMLRRECPNPKVVVELGTYCGLWAGQLLKEHPAVGELFCIDHFKKYRNWTLWREAVSDHYEKVTPLPVEIEHAEHMWEVFIKKKIDILYVDADHRSVCVLKNLNFWVPWVRVGGIILCHDWQMSGPRRAIKRFFGKENVNVEKFGPLQFCESAWLRKKEEHDL